MLDCIVPDELIQDFDKDRPEDLYLITDLYPVYRDIVKAINPASVLEIGSRYGYSLAVALDAGSQITRAVSVDMVSGVAQYGGVQGAVSVMEANLRAMQPVRWPLVHFDFYDINTQLVSSLPFSGPFDLIYVDGDHSPLGCLHDLFLTYPLLSPSGFLVVDDMDWHPELRGPV